MIDSDSGDSGLSINRQYESCIICMTCSENLTNITIGNILYVHSNWGKRIILLHSRAVYTHVYKYITETCLFCRYSVDILSLDFHSSSHIHKCQDKYQETQTRRVPTSLSSSILLYFSLSFSLYMGMIYYLLRPLLDNTFLLLPSSQINFFMLTLLSVLSFLS